MEFVVRYRNRLFRNVARKQWREMWCSKVFLLKIEKFGDGWGNVRCLSGLLPLLVHVRRGFSLQQTINKCRRMFGWLNGFSWLMLVWLLMKMNYYLTNITKNCPAFNFSRIFQTSGAELAGKLASLLFATYLQITAYLITKLCKTIRVDTLACQISSPANMLHDADLYIMINFAYLSQQSMT